MLAARGKDSNYDSGTMDAAEVRQSHREGEGKMLSGQNSNHMGGVDDDHHAVVDSGDESNSESSSTSPRSADTVHEMMAMQVTEERPLRARGTDGDALLRHKLDGRSVNVRTMRRRLELSPAPPDPHREMPLTIVSDLLTRVQQITVRGQIAGCVAAIITCVILLVASANGVVIAIGMITTGIAAGRISARLGFRKDQRVHELPEPQAAARN